jgi:hypothetical protein
MKFKLDKDDVKAYLDSVDATSLAQIMLYADGRPIKHHLTKKVLLAGLASDTWKQNIDVTREAEYAIQTFVTDYPGYAEAVTLTRKSNVRQQKFKEGDFRLHSVMPMLSIAAVGHARNAGLRESLLFAFGIKALRPAKAIAPAPKSSTVTAVIKSAAKSAADLNKLAAESIHLLEMQEYVDDEIQKVGESMRSKKSSSDDKSDAAVGDVNDADGRDVSPVRTPRKGRSAKPKPSQKKHSSNEKSKTTTSKKRSGDPRTSSKSKRSKTLVVSVTDA